MKPTKRFTFKMGASTCCILATTKEEAVAQLAKNLNQYLCPFSSTQREQETKKARQEALSADLVKIETI